MISSENKTKLIKYGIFTGIILVMFVVLFLFIFLSKSTWNKELKNTIDKALTVSEMNEYKTGSEVKMNTALTTSCKIYHLSKNGKQDEKTKYIVLIRSTTLFGPIAALYYYDSILDESTFIDYLCIDGAIKEKLIEITNNSQILYWSKRIPSIISSSTVNNTLKNGEQK